ncbi:hypothetical protein [uncultured Campylobacter sp.]|uniref:hypothetical protein n=1 Tax=uncultured Campylobacter sp. TaxID=218934 RepID=UPI0026130BEC|nr:hypothetical protein [uncultured Campylobacter sp.]
MQCELAGSFTIRLVNSAAAGVASSFDLKIRQNLARAPVQNTNASAPANALCLKPETDEVR